MEKDFSDKYFKPIFIGLCMLCAILYVLLCQGDLVWMDEAYTLGMIRRSYADMWRITALDVHPPLYYVLLKTFALPFVNEILAGKLFSAIMTLVTLVLGGLEIKKLFNAKTAILFGLVFMLFPFLVTYGVEIRMYSLGGFFVTFNAIYAYKAFLTNSSKDWIIFTLWGICAAYTHYFALVSAGVVYGLLLVFAIAKKRELLKGWAISAIATVVLYLPWLRYFIVQLKYKIDNEYWIAPITFKTIGTYFNEIFGIDKNRITAIAIFSVFVVIFACAIKANKTKKVLIWSSIAVPVCTLLVGLLASWVVRPVFVVRYLLPSAPVLCLGIAIAFSHINKKSVIISLVGILTVTGITNYTYAYHDRNTHFEDRFDVAFYERNRDCDAYIVYIDRDDISPGQTETVLAFYEQEKEIYQVVENYGYYPFENFRYIENFKADNYETVTLLLAEGKEIPQELAEKYNAEYKETATSLWIMADVYKLTRK